MDTLARNHWQRIERGWHVHPEIGGCVHERDGWYFYPKDRPVSERLGPFRALADAKLQAEILHAD